MLNEEILVHLKIDLLISSDAQDRFLEQCIEYARQCIKTEGITIRDDVYDGKLIEMYAAHIYRSRRTSEPMPRMLRWALNNRLFSEKGAQADG